jgi:hypothetical protein
MIFSQLFILQRAPVVCKHIHRISRSDRCVRTETTGSNKTCWTLLARHPSMLGHQHYGRKRFQSLTEHLALVGKGNLLLQGGPDPEELAHFIKGSAET